MVYPIDRRDDIAKWGQRRATGRLAIVVSLWCVAALVALQAFIAWFYATKEGASATLMVEEFAQGFRLLWFLWAIWVLMLIWAIATHYRARLIFVWALPFVVFLFQFFTVLRGYAPSLNNAFFD